MSRKPARLDHNLRRVLALEAARLIVDHGIDDHYVAKRKAAERLGVSGKGALPKNSEIEAAVAEHQRLFAADSHARHLRKLRQTARQAMQLFAEFDPRLVGSVLSGTAAATADVELHLFTDTPEHVTLRLIDGDVPHTVAQKRIRTTPKEYAHFPAFKFVAGDTGIEATVFPLIALRQAPVSPVDGKTMQRASLNSLEDLLAGGVGESQ